MSEAEERHQRQGVNEYPLAYASERMRQGEESLRDDTMGSDDRMGGDSAVIGTK